MLLARRLQGSFPHKFVAGERTGFIYSRPASRNCSPYQTQEFDNEYNAGLPRGRYQVLRSPRLTARNLGDRWQPHLPRAQSPAHNHAIRRRPLLPMRVAPTFRSYRVALEEYGQHYIIHTCISAIHSLHRTSLNAPASLKLSFFSSSRHPRFRWTDDRCCRGNFSSTVPNHVPRCSTTS